MFLSLIHFIIDGGSHHGDNKKVNKITAFFPREAGPSTFDPEKLAKKLARAPTVATSGMLLDILFILCYFDSCLLFICLLHTAASDVTSSSNSTTSTQQSSTSASNSTPSNTIPSSALATINDLKRQVDSLKVLKEQQESKICRLDNDVKLINEKLKLSEERNSKVLKVLEDVYRNMAIQNARRKRDRLAADCVRLGKISTIRVSPSSLQDIWEEGYSLKELNAKINILTERKEELERRRKRLQSVKRISAKKNGNNVTLEAIVNDEDSFDSNTNAIDLDIIAEENAIKTHFEQIKKDEAILLEEKRLLESEKASHQKELKRCQSEDHSRFFQDLPLLNHRYLLMSLLGRGGFSEVWKAMDLVELKEVAVKLHQLNTSWSDARKQSYVKHVTREYTIHRDMMHPRVVQLYDVFEIDVNSFATVLEYCKGIDLDEKLKTCKTIPEKDAKTIILQIISGLRYLNSPHIPSSLMNSAAASSSSGNGDVSDAETANINVATMTSPNQMNTNTAAATSIALASGIPNSTQVRKRSIIHFDLKPANILFDEMGDVKITDFGLSKILDEGDNGSMTSMELTSQGAGTYWYLPPECFVGNEDEPPRYK
jgi:hypothetical protein